jgi:hypothetical protein
MTTWTFLVYTENGHSMQGAVAVSAVCEDDAHQEARLRVARDLPPRAAFALKPRVECRASRVVTPPVQSVECLRSKGHEGEHRGSILDLTFCWRD